MVKLLFKYNSLAPLAVMTTPYVPALSVEFGVNINVHNRLIQSSEKLRVFLSNTACSSCTEMKYLMAARSHVVRESCM